MNTNDSRAPQCAIYSITKAAKQLGIRRETLRLAIKRGELQMRHLPGRKRPVLTDSDLTAWQSSLPRAPYPASNEARCPPANGAARPCNPLLAPAEVRQAWQVPLGSNGSGQTKPLAATSRTVVVAILGENWRVIDDGVQWILQKRHGRPTPKSTRWRGRSYVTSQKSLLGSVARWCGAMDPDALRVLEALPHEHPRGGGDRNA